MSMRCSTRVVRRWRRSSGALAALGLAICTAFGPDPAEAQMMVFDAKTYAQSALQAARELQALSNQAAMLANQARELAASPYSLLAQSSQTLSDIGQIAQSARGIAANVGQLQGQFQSLYPAAVSGIDPRTLLQQAQSRTTAARDTAQDLARTAAELEQLSQGRAARVSGALSASQGAQGTTSAIQSSAQLLAVLSEDMGTLRAITLAQSRLMAEEAAQRAADQAASAETHRRLWAHPAETIAPPSFNPFPHAQN